MNSASINKKGLLQFHNIQHDVSPFQVAFQGCPVATPPLQGVTVRGICAVRRGGSGTGSVSDMLLHPGSAPALPGGPAGAPRPGGGRGCCPGTPCRYPRYRWTCELLLRFSRWLCREFCGIEWTLFNPGLSGSGV